MTLAEQSRHLNDGCVENVEYELRCDANGEHEQRDRNDRDLFPRQKIRKGAAILCQRPTEKRLHRAHENDRCNKQADHRKSREGCSNGKRTFEDQKLANETV